MAAKKRKKPEPVPEIIRGARLTVRFSDDEYALVQRVALASTLNESTWIRMVCIAAARRAEAEAEG